MTSPLAPVLATLEAARHLHQSRAIQGSGNDGKLAGGLVQKMALQQLLLVPTILQASAHPLSRDECKALLATLSSLPSSLLEGMQTSEGKTGRELVDLAMLSGVISAGWDQAPAPNKGEKGSQAAEWHALALACADNGWHRALAAVVSSREKAQFFTKGGWRQTGIAVDRMLEASSHWAWMVRNYPMGVLSHLARTGGGEGLDYDQKGRTVLAYARSEGAARLLLESGVDPLDPHRPLAARLRAFGHLFAEKAGALCEVSAVRHYAKERIQSWSVSEQLRLAAWAQACFEIEVDTRPKDKGRLEHLYKTVQWTIGLYNPTAVCLRTGTLGDALARRRLMGTPLKGWGLHLENDPGANAENKGNEKLSAWQYLNALSLPTAMGRDLPREETPSNVDWKELKQALLEVASSPSLTPYGWESVTRFWKTQWKGPFSIEEQAALAVALLGGRTDLLQNKDLATTLGRGTWPTRIASFVSTHGDQIGEGVRAHLACRLLALAPLLHHSPQHALREKRMARFARWTGEGVNRGVISTEDPFYQAIMPGWGRKSPAHAAMLQEQMLEASTPAPARQARPRM